jgi:hypothetical protein
MARRLRIVKGPNVKKLLSFAAFAAIVGATALPAGAVTSSGTVNVKWNVSVTANISLHTNYDASGNPLTAAPSILLSTGPGGTGEACTPPASETDLTVDFGTITPDSGLAKNTDCLFKNAVNAKVTTNSVSWSVGEYISTPAANPAGSTLCAYSNGFASYPATVTGAAAVAQSARATYTDNTTCAAGALTLGTSASTNNLATSTTAYPGGANIGQDLGLLLTPAAATGTEQPVVTFSLVAN